MYYIDFLSLFAEATSEGASQKVAEPNGSGFMCDGTTTAAAATRYTPTIVEVRTHTVQPKAVK